MRNLEKCAIYIALAATLFACKKEHLQPGTTTNGSPVFSFTGLVNGMPVNLQSGINNYYMYSSYTQDANNVYNFTGALQPVGCNGCANTIKITINDYKTTPIGAPATIDSALRTGYYVYLAPSGGVSTAFTVTFTPTIGSGTPSTYVYNFGDGGVYSGIGGTQTHTYLQPGIYTPALTVHFSDTIVDSIKTTTLPGAPVPTYTTALTVFSSNTSNNTIVFLDSINGSPGTYVVQWNFGDGQTATKNYYLTGHDTIPHQYALHGAYNVFAKVTDANNAVTYNYLHCIAKDSATYNPTDYISTLALSSVPVANPKAFSNINIVYADANGNVYTSAKANQPSSSYFQVLSVSNYQNNENNQTTKQLHIQFSCKLVDSKSDTIQITNGQAVMAVAYK